LTELAVRSTSHGKPFFGVKKPIEVIDATERLLAQKFDGRYESSAPRELLVYWAASPAPVTPEWRDKILAFVRAGLSASRFRRVWCFDLFNRAVVLVYPAPTDSPERASSVAKGGRCTGWAGRVPIPG